MEMTVSEFFFDLPIYTPVNFDEGTMDVYRKILDYSKREEFEGYNPWRKIESTFVVQTNLIPYNDNFHGHGRIQIKCKRTDEVFVFYVIGDANIPSLMKTGQYPSVADFHMSEIKKYKKLLPNEKLKEFSRAIGLAANGVGIGSFVYLRRIFEHLIAEAYVQCLAENLVTEEQYSRSRMDQKINLLSAHLPVFLVENRSMYSVLSVGIHELDENTCLSHFDTLRVGIEIILDEKLDELKKKEKIEDAKRKLAKLASEANKP
ncbi:hypothetical protein QLG02_04925 [Aeromonas sp. V90_14]|uniref:hypothetical protein n=1 Tax=Aeromonas sp. V90_14 TaxID=3044241 RepID=UPI00249E6C13|nr:hypothetical protein [Aeromonas sp. V90_14]MDI3429671.1 hypothetical protein [Aeromonas sp. V90_14]